MTAPRYKPGDRVAWNDFGLRFGTVVKVARVTAEVQRDGASKPERVSVDLLRLETAADVAKRERDADLRAWEASRPQLSHAKVAKPSIWGSSLPIGAQIYGVLRTPAEMRQAADELRLLADWFEQKPKEE